MKEPRVLNDIEKREWLRAKGQTRTGPHGMKGRICHWPYCTKCGLVALKNEPSRKALAKPCVWEED